jgi:hypothetical protein
MTSRDGTPLADHVIGMFPREALSGALAATHRAGFGPQTRVLDGARDHPARQLERMGLRRLEGDEPLPDAILIVVTAPGRTAIVADLFHRLGAANVALATSRAARPAPERMPMHLPDIRIGGDAGVQTET